MTSFIGSSLRGIVFAHARRNQRDVHGLVGQLNIAAVPFSARGLEPVGVIAFGKFGFVMRAARFVARAGAHGDDPGENQHVPQFTREVQGLVGPCGAVAQVDPAVARLQFLQCAAGFLQVFVDARDGDVLGHDLAEFAPDGQRVLAPVLRDQRPVLFFLPLAFAIVNAGLRRVRAFIEVLRVLYRGRPGDAAAENTGDQRIGAETVRAVVLVFAFPRGEDARNTGGLVFGVHPHAAHGVVHAGENLHRLFARVHAEKLFVDFQNAFEFAVEGLARDVADVEINGGFSIEAELFLVNDAVNGARGDVARNEVPVLRVPLLEKIEALFFRNALCRALVRGISRDPDAAAFAARGLAHQTQLVFAGDRRRMDLDEFPVGVIHTLLKERRLRRTGAHHGIRRLPENRADAAGAEDHRIRRKSFHFHGAQIHGADAAANAGIVDYRGKKSKTFEFFDFAFGFMAAHLLIERVQQLLPRGGAGKSGAVVKRASEPPIIEQAFRRAVEHHAHAVEQIDDSRRGFAHALDQRLIREEIAAVNRVVKVLPGGVAFAFLILRRVNAALRANGMRALYGHDGE